LLAAFAVPLIALVGWNQAHYNFGEFQSGRFYRSGQMPARALSQAIREHGIRSVLNLRGPNPSEPWYRDERAAAIAGGASQIDIAMSSCEWMSRAQLKTLIQTLETCEYPILVHCAWGAERTGLVSAFAELLRPGATLDDAYDQFSLRHLFVRVKDGKVMAEHLDQYAEWLRRQNKTHSPDLFHRWVAQGYTPGTPSREQWPYDPYPLIVVTRPPDSRDSNARPVQTQADQSIEAPDTALEPAFRRR
jgi:protein tyrosine phosphatase (PTP) superfamily phosphohydrolase (DUF442 family)